MIKPEELRIGNLFQDSKGTIHKVSSTTFRAVELNALDIHHIPLTEELLKKLGLFCYGKKRNWYDDENHKFSISTSGNWALYLNNEWITIGKVDYIHQLQNLYFALTGMELTIKL